MILLLCVDKDCTLCGRLRKCGIGSGYENARAFAVQMSCVYKFNARRQPVPRSLSGAKLVKNLKLFHTRMKNIFCWGLKSLKVVYARHARTFALKKKWWENRSKAEFCYVFLILQIQLTARFLKFHLVCLGGITVHHHHDVIAYTKQPNK